MRCQLRRTLFYGSWWRHVYMLEADAMQEGIHPKYEEITATCSCGNVIKVKSTLCKDIHLDVCAKCHPFYTGTQKVMDTGGRIERFNKRFGALSSKR